MDSISSEEMEAIELDVLNRKLSHDERRIERIILSSVKAVHGFINISLNDLDSGHSPENAFYRLKDDEQEYALQYLLELRENGRRAPMMKKRILDIGINIEQVPQKYFDMSLEELKTEIENWRWPTIGL